MIQSLGLKSYRYHRFFVLIAWPTDCPLPITQTVESPPAVCRDRPGVAGEYLDRPGTAAGQDLSGRSEHRLARAGSKRRRDRNSVHGCAHTPVSLPYIDSELNRGCPSASEPQRKLDRLQSPFSAALRFGGNPHLDLPLACPSTNS